MAFRKTRETLYHESLVILHLYAAFQSHFLILFTFKIFSLCFNFGRDKDKERSQAEEALIASIKKQKVIERHEIG